VPPYLGWWETTLRQYFSEPLPPFIKSKCLRALAHFAGGQNINNVRDLLDMMKQGVRFWSEDNAARLSASLAFFAMLAISPLLVLAVIVAGMILGEGEARTRILEQAEGAVGPQGAEFLAGIIDQAAVGGGAIIPTVISLIVIFYGASNLFFQLRNSMDYVWKIKPREDRHFVKTFLIQRGKAFLSVLAAGIVIIGLLLLEGFLTYLSRRAGIDNAGLAWLWTLLTILISTAFWSVVFAAAFKLLPSRRIEWSSVWIAGIITAIAFTLGKIVLGLYFEMARVQVAYGAAGALVIILLWTFYNAQIFFFGAELSRAMAHRLHEAPEEEISPAHPGASESGGADGVSAEPKERADERPRQPAFPAPAGTAAIVPHAAERQRVEEREPEVDLGMLRPAAGGISLLGLGALAYAVWRRRQDEA
jgi:membrane protein